MNRIKKNDTVIVIAGKERGKKGTVMQILPKKGKLKIKGLNLVTKHSKARKQGEQSAIKKIEAYIDLSNVMLVSEQGSEPSRVNFKILEDGKKARMLNRTKAII